MPFKTIKNLFSWSKQKLLSLRTINKETETTRKVEIEEGDFEQRPNTLQKNIQDRNMTRTQQTENNYTQQNANTKRIALTIAALFLEVFVNEFYNIIWQPRCKLIAEWEYTKGIKKQDLRKKPLAHQCIIYKRILTLQTEDGIYDLKKRKILKHNEQWLIVLEKARQYINQFIREGNRRIVEAYTEIL
ncbi:hypothetical protein RhiirA1_476122 [Rhizophagus irregularis]|uniref:Uncharacterized protein n=1 Tax=Rhizophagus irregularis TaxID=588596 RepID=A0A2N0QVP8_9GLOM|nr:hypothetical protein RhiirA1_476122 [Rhizophagus irregularis]